jgi:DNA repair protein RAD5
MDIKKRNEAVSEFKYASRKPKVLIVSLKAGGVGLNVSFSAARYIHRLTESYS